VLFVDLVGSTEMAYRRPASEVVELLNRYFAIVIDVVEAHGGLINKFAGDAALAIFGAPAPLDDRCARALAAARTLARRVQLEVPDCDFGIGVSAGPVVAGNVGGASRLEYTVIGDPVNEASRLAEIAKTMTGRVAASGAIIDGSGEEAGAWSHADSATMRGRASPTDIYGWDVAGSPAVAD
jgi:adenylate cyclase